MKKLLLVAMVAALIGLAPVPAEAHDKNMFFRTYWSTHLTPPGHGGAIYLYFTNEWDAKWSQNWIDRSVNARDAWPWGGGDYRPLTYFLRTDSDWDFQNNCNYPNGIHFGWTDGAGRNYWAQTTHCLNTVTRQITDTQIRFDNLEWWTNTATRHPDLLDFQSVMTHELAHAWGGWGPNGGTIYGEDGHFGFDPVCDDRVSAVHTMCPTIEYGQGYWRSPESHDIHTMDAGYPNG